MYSVCLRGNDLYGCVTLRRDLKKGSGEVNLFTIFPKVLKWMMSLLKRLKQLVG